MKLYKSYLEDPSDNIVEAKEDEIVSEDELLTEAEILPDLLVDCLLESNELTELFLDYIQEADADKKETKKEKFKRYLKTAGKAALVGAAGYGAYTAATKAKAAYPGAKAAATKKGKEVKVAAAATKKKVVATGKEAAAKVKAAAKEIKRKGKLKGKELVAAYQLHRTKPHDVKIPYRPKG
jgi:hypothetical protein